MTYQPVIPISGYGGWVFLERTRETQQAAFDNSAAISRSVEYFTENIGGITSAEDLVNDRRLLQVALGAFGLDEDINNKFFLQKVLEDGTIEDDALGNRLSDKRYLEFSRAFGFGDLDTPRTALSFFPEEITSTYKTKQFEIAVGNADPTMRLALGLEEALTAIVDRDTSDNGRWFSVMGQPPVREVFEVALGLPASFGALDIEQQVEEFRDRTSSRFGDGEVSQFSDPEKREELLRLFLLRAEPTAGLPDTSGNAALTLLQGAAGANAATLFDIIAQ